VTPFTAYVERGRHVLPGVSADGAFPQGAKCLANHVSDLFVIFISSLLLLLFLSCSFVVISYLCFLMYVFFIWQKTKRHDARANG
jgi:hypothetical protein